MMIQKFMPSSATHTKVHYEVYRNKDSSEEDFRTIADTYARVMKEDKALCDRAQANLNAGVFINGELHPSSHGGGGVAPVGPADERDGAAPTSEQRPPASTSSTCRRRWSR